MIDGTCLKNFSQPLPDRMNETAKENGFIPGMAREMTGAHRPQNMDIKLLHAKKQQGSFHI